MAIHQGSRDQSRDEEGSSEDVATRQPSDAGKMQNVGDLDPEYWISPTLTTRVPIPEG